MWSSAGLSTRRTFTSLYPDVPSLPARPTGPSGEGQLAGSLGRLVQLPGLLGISNVRTSLVRCGDDSSHRVVVPCTDFTGCKSVRGRSSQGLARSSRRGIKQGQAAAELRTQSESFQ